MGRGRRPIHPDVKRLKGNAKGGRLPPPENVVTFPGLAKPIEIPAFLTGEIERAIFRTIVEDYLQRRVARPPDYFAYGRYAHYMQEWMSCKSEIDCDGRMLVLADGEGKSTKQRSIAVKHQFELESLLRQLEDRLGLNPMARTSIMRAMTAVPPALVTVDAPIATARTEDDSVEGGEATAGLPAGSSSEAQPSMSAASPLGWLFRDKMN